MKLTVENLYVEINGLKILNDINIDVDNKEIVSFVGANGAGKSVLLRTICGLEKPTSGRIIYEGKNIAGLSPKAIADLGITMVPEGKQLYYEMTVAENLKIGGYKYRKESERIKSNMHKVFGLFPVLALNKNRIAGTLSGGEQQMLSIGRALMCEPKLLLVDELSLGLAPKIITMLLETMVQLNEEGMTIIMVEQNIKQVLQVASRGYVIENGNLVMEGTGRELLNNEHVKRAYLGI